MNDLGRYLPTLAAAAALSACSADIQETYELDIVGPVGADYLAGARELVLELGDNEVARAPLAPGRPVRLEGSGIDVQRIPSAVFSVKAMDGSRLVAFGQTPEVELALDTPPLLRVFIQPPGTFGRAQPLVLPRKDHIAVPVVAPPPESVRATKVQVALFGTGRVVDENPEMVRREGASDGYNVYNSLTHLVDYVGATPAVAMVAQPRFDAAAAVRSDGSVIVFGGTVEPNGDGRMARPASVLDWVRVVRGGFNSFALQFVVNAARVTDAEGIARTRPALAAIGNSVYAFGGRNQSGPLDTVLLLDPLGGDPFRLVPVKMAAAREGATASAAIERGEVLVVGGTVADGAPLAELFVTGQAPRMMPLEGDLGPPRRDHVAVPLPGNDGRVVIACGAGPDGQPLAEGLLYRPTARALQRNALTLRHPRVGCAGFVVEGDLVIVGGAGADGQPIGQAEIFSSADLQPRGTTAAHPRRRPTATSLGNGSAVIIGGQEADGTTSAVVEVYQPAR